MGIYDTEIITGYLEHCDDIEELKKQILPKLQDQRDRWKEKIEQILNESGYSCKQLALLCGVSEPAVRKWRKGSLPQNRDMFIRIGFAAGYNIDQMNLFLRRYGRCPKLYFKSLEDCVCMFVLNSKSLPHTYRCYEDVLNYVKGELERESLSGQFAYSTSQLSVYFANLDSMEEMIQFAKTCAPSYKDAYSRLYDYILTHMRINLHDVVDDRYVSFHSMASESKWSSSLRHCISEIRNGKWFPLRQKIISLGLHLNMDLDEINTMLQYAQMEPLYSKNPIEAAVIFALEEAKLNEIIFVDGSNQLCQFVKDVLTQLDLNESEYLIDDL